MWIPKTTRFNFMLEMGHVMSQFKPDRRLHLVILETEFILLEFQINSELIGFSI